MDEDTKTTYSDTELEAMMADVESEFVERKESLRAAPDGKDGPIERIRQAVCAFANDFPGHRRPGVVFVGVRDDGTPSGIDVTDRLLQRLADVKTDGNTLPPPVLSVAKRRLAGSAVALVTVHPSDAPPVRARGRIWITSIERPTPTVVGLLTLGTRPQDFIPGAYIQFLRIAGTEFPGDMVDDAVCTGPVARQLARLTDKFDAHNRTAVDFTSAPRELRRSTHSAEARRQIAYNAVMHRTYEATHAPVRVSWDPPGRRPRRSRGSVPHHRRTERALRNRAGARAPGDAAADDGPARREPRARRCRPRRDRVRPAGQRRQVHAASRPGRALGDRAGTCVDPKTQELDGGTVCVVSCQRSPEPVFLRWKGMERGEEGDFFVRSGPGTVKLEPESTERYVETRFRRDTATTERSNDEHPS